jgi:glycosyltransferase involved in cell wall biosynthesis
MGDFADFLTGFFRRERTPYHVMHANFFMSGLAGLKVKRALGIPLVTTFHALGRVRRLHQGRDDGFPDERFGIEDELVRHSDAIIAECPQDEADLIGLYQADAERIEIVPCGFDADEFHPVARNEARAALGWPQHRFIVLQLGRIVQRKGIDNVIRGVGMLKTQHGLDAQLYVVGGNSDAPNEIATPEIARLRGIARHAGVEQATTFVGRRGREQLHQFYSAADVFVTTPWYEPFGITPVEAMACATPVIGADVGGIRHTVKEGETGWLVPPRDPAALATRLAALQRDPALARRMGEAGLARARTEFTWNGVAAALKAVYARVADVNTVSGRNRVTDALRSAAGGAAR